MLVYGSGPRHVLQVSPMISTTTFSAFCLGIRCTVHKVDNERTLIDMCLIGMCL